MLQFRSMTAEWRGSRNLSDLLDALAIKKVADRVH